MNKEANLIRESSRSYRGITEITLRWEENGGTCEKEFNEAAEAAIFKRQLLQRLTAQAEAETKASEVKDEALERLEAMSLEVVDAANIIEQLMRLAPEGYDYWIESLKAHRKTAELCTEAKVESVEKLFENHRRVEFLDNMLQPDGLNLEKVVEDFSSNSIENVSIKEMSEVYKRYCELKLQSTDLLNDYKTVLESQEPDEDERHYVFNKLKKLVEHFEGDIISTDLNQAREWIVNQPGSGSAKERLTEIVEDFYDFIEEQNSKIVKKSFVA